MAKLLALVLFAVFITASISATRGLNAVCTGLKESVVCEGNASTICCKTGYTISIDQAIYGRYDRERCPSRYILTTQCFSSISTRIVRTSCNGRRSCSLIANSSVFGDPCSGTYKYLRTLYKCNKSISSRVVICENSSSRIQCPRGKLININSASYGRQDRITCLSPAIKTTSCSAQTAYTVVRRKCHDKNSCRLYASNSVYGDPCNGTYKYLSVSYSCMTPRPKVAIACEGRRRLITCPYGKMIRIRYANYGRTSRRTCPSSSIRTTRCYARDSNCIVADSCNGRRRCILRPFNRVFGDPCYGTYKYLRVHYNCI